MRMVGSRTRPQMALDVGPTQAAVVRHTPRTTHSRCSSPSWRTTIPRGPRERWACMDADRPVPSRDALSAGRRHLMLGQVVGAQGGSAVGYHNETCGCAECGNYGQAHNPGAVHNQSCGCAECGNYPERSGVPAGSASPKVGSVMVEVPVELLDQVRALIAKQRGPHAEPPSGCGHTPDSQGTGA